jgi:hypothetical protein
MVLKRVERGREKGITEQLRNGKREDCGIGKEKLPLGPEEIIRKRIKVKIYLV